jgi:two-component system, NarL family, sensor histidine kinase UhpB
MSHHDDSFNVLVVEDNPADQFLLEQMLRQAPLAIKHTYAATTLKEASDIIAANDIHLVLLDLSLPDSFGVESIRHINGIAPLATIVVLTGLASTETALESIKENAQDYLVKGQFNSGGLCKSIEYSMERKRIEESIRVSEEKYKQIFYKNPFPVWIYDETTLQILEVNDAALKKYGYTKTEFLQLTTHALQLQQSPDRHEVRNTEAGQQLLHKKKSGELMNVQVTSYPIHYFQRKAIQIQVNDITEKVRLEKALRLQKQQLVEAVFDAQESERKNIGREIHDNINQVLTAVKLNLSIALDHEALSHKIIDKSIANVASVIDELRRLSKELIVPGNLKELGLVQGINDLLTETLQFSTIHWQFLTDGFKDVSLTEDQKLAIYRIVQEQISNIIKYAAATSITIRLRNAGTQIHLRILDNGKGFDTGKPRFGIGFNNIISRAELYNGNVQVKSAPGAGCELEVYLDTKQNSYASKPAVPSKIFASSILG